MSDDNTLPLMREFIDAVTPRKATSRLHVLLTTSVNEETVCTASCTAKL